MTQDEVIEMAIQGHASTRDAIRWAMNQEREACVHVCREIYSAWMCETDEDVDAPDPNDCIRAIRARGSSND